MIHSSHKLLPDDGISPIICGVCGSHIVRELEYPCPGPQIRLSQHAAENVKGTSAIEAANKIADKGGSPRAQLDAAREATGKDLGYTSHQGAKQRRKALAKMNKMGENNA